MQHKPLHRAVASLACGLFLAGSFAVVPTFAQGMSSKQMLRFAADMARQGNWREASFRWEQLSTRLPDSPRILNNLAVANEVLGNHTEVKQLYAKALAITPWDAPIRDNQRRFLRYWRETNPGAEDRPAPVPSGKTGSPGKKGKTLKVSVGLPVPPRMELEGERSLLVASFLGQETNLLDVNRELVRFLRSEFRKRTEFDVLDVTPAPAVPEQTLEDLIRNHEFWRYLGRNHGADLIVSGAVNYDREDMSSFREVDIVSPTTGQKVRQNRFVEQEQFDYGLDVIFMDGHTGELRFRDRLQRSVIYRGLSNDPIGAFYAMSESISDDVLAVVTQQLRQETRVIYKQW